MIGRRGLVASVLAGWLTDQARARPGAIEGRIVGASHGVGHRLRGPIAPPTGPSEEADVVIVGSGVSGASAAWRLASLGIEVCILELEPFAGGTSSWSDDGPVPHPWGAHYLPVPERGAHATARLLEQLGVITGWDLASRPMFDDAMLCHAPEERLFYQGGWHTGLVPTDALGAREKREMDRFRDQTQALREAIGSDGRPAFAIPVEQSSRDARFVGLDAMSMGEWLTREGFETEFARWYAEYGCLDDFGGDLDEVSAWAGIHYFSSRKLETEQTEGSRYLVWPEGNGWLVRRMLDKVHGQRRQGVLVTGIGPAKRGVEVACFDVATGSARRIEARAAVVAAPAFVARRMLSGAILGQLEPRTASPWLVANLHVHGEPDPDRHWDNMIHGSLGLGYVDASHQLTHLADRTVLTYFRPYGSGDVGGSRAALLRRGWPDLASEVLADLVVAHPDLPAHTDRIDVMLWGHAMPRPRPGFLGASPFHAPLWLGDRVAWAHVDQTGLALFEEANLHGVRAAEAIARRLGADIHESWV